ncbi:hypothetical protein Q9L58_010011 [Maublancomyces gigas]|uniref:Uncharacterized protein n=1 Tax=Discina gigas TaxID=1032678 RepID=A0ABR3G6D3_9PEZI
MLRATMCTIRSNSTQVRARMQKRFYDREPMPTPHTTEKPHNLDVQTAASKSGIAERQRSQETKEANVQKQDPKKEFPEAPGPIIGMQDERGHSTLITPWSSLGIVLGV